MKFRLRNGADDEERSGRFQFQHGKAERKTPIVEAKQDEPVTIESNGDDLPKYRSSEDYLELKVRLHQRIIDEGFDFIRFSRFNQTF